MPEIETFGSFRVRPIGGGSLQGARLFRSCELKAITADEATVLVKELGVQTIYDLRNKWEATVNPEPYILGTKTVTVRSTTEGNRKNAADRLKAGVIGEYGAPEERMINNYRKYARISLPLMRVLKMIAHDNDSALIHCVNGKDRTGVLSATMLRIGGVHHDEVMEDYLAANEVNAESIAYEAEILGQNMTSEERAILMSFLEVRPSYLDAFFDEIEVLHGSFDRYVSEGLQLPLQARGTIAQLLSVR